QRQIDADDESQRNKARDILHDILRVSPIRLEFLHGRFQDGFVWNRKRPWYFQIRPGSDLVMDFTTSALVKGITSHSPVKVWRDARGGPVSVVAKYVGGRQ